MELLTHGGWTGFSSLPKLHVIKRKFSMNKVYSLWKWIDPLSDQAIYIGEIKNKDANKTRSKLYYNRLQFVKETQTNTK